MSNKKNKRNNGNRRGGNRNKTVTPKFKPREEVVTDIEYFEGISVKDLAEKINKSPSEIIKLLFMMGTMVTINTSLDDETVELICMEFNVTPTKAIPVDTLSIEEHIEDEDEKDLVNRPAIVTIMGHVDHGKTTTLDTIRNASVVDGEAGGITQHIGAYQITHNGHKITFLDTPGHEAFTAMRARGAKVTDIVIVVVAADDGVMPQTREAIDHAKAAKAPLIVAINKIDKPSINIDRVYSELSDAGVMPEEWGGETVFVKISAKTGEGIDQLLETVLVAAELEELKANPNKEASGTVIEAKLDKGRGPVATLLVQNGTLNHGDSIVVGTSFGKIRKMVDHRSNELQHATPSTPVEIIGLSDVPVAGDLFKVFSNEKEARSMAEKRNTRRIEKERNQTSAMNLEDLSQQIAEGNVKEINVILKADVQGSAEAMKDALQKIEIDDVRINVIRSTVGGITESDIMLASASGAIIIGFNIRPSSAIRKKADEEGIEIRLYDVIYKALEAMELVMKGMMAPVFEEVIFGQAEVRELYKVSKIGTIAGCMVTDGKMVKDTSVRLIRDGVVIYNGVINSLKRFQNDVKEVAQGYECGLTIEHFNDIKIGDIIESHGEEQVEQE